MLAESLSNALRVFRIWRRTRPFWGGLLIISGACEILMSEQGPLALVIHIGIQGLAGYLIPVMLLLCGVLIWFTPAQRAFYSLLAIVLALGSWVTSNLGGFFIGMVLGLVGGALAFAWAVDPDTPALRWFRGNPQILQPSFGVELVLRPTAALPPPRRAIESAGTAYWSAAAPSPAVILIGRTDDFDDDSAAVSPAPISPGRASTASPLASGLLTYPEDSDAGATTGARPPPGTPPARQPGFTAASGCSHRQEMPSEGCISLRAASVRLPVSDG